MAGRIEKYFERAPNYEPTENNRPKRFTRSAIKKRSRVNNTGRNNLAKGARLANRVSVIKTNMKKATDLIMEVDTLPVYLIAAHSCICKKEGKCYGEDAEFSFQIPEDTYIINMVQPGDTSCTDDYQVVSHVDSIRMFLYVHGTDDTELQDTVGKSKFSFFGGIQRAVGPSEQPNIAYTFNEMKDGKLLPRSENPYGVYDITHSAPRRDFKNSESIIPQDPSRNNWFLKDVIKEVYAAKGIRKAIFVSSGCLDSCGKGDPTGLNAAATIMYIANEEYKTHRETLTAGELAAIQVPRPFNRGIHRPHYAFEPAEMQRMLNAGLINAEGIAAYPNLIHNSNKQKVEKMIDRKLNN
jgi:hypothetical protein